MTASTFANASGWPDPNHRMSMRDLDPGAAADRGVPEYYPIFAETEFNYQTARPTTGSTATPC